MILEAKIQNLLKISRLSKISKLLTLLLTLTFVSLSYSQNSFDLPPNIIFLLADDLGYGDLSFNGNPYPTPNIDKLASKSFYFNQYYSPASVCTPSRGSMLTGKYFRRLGLYPGVLLPYMIGGLNQSYITYPSILQANGYSTGMIGKWHLGLNQGHAPWEHGFGYYYGLPLTQNVCYSQLNGTDSITNNSHYGYCPIFRNQKIIHQYKLNFQELDSLYYQEAINFIENNSKNPYYLHISFHHTHVPLYPSNDYHSSLTALDNWIGNLVNYVENNYLENNYLENTRETIIILTSDNGSPYWFGSQGGLNSPFRCCKGSTWEGGHRVPAMIYYSGIKANRSNVLMTGLDWFSTILSMANISDKNWFDGYNFWNYIREPSNSQPPRKEFYYHSIRTPEPITSKGSVMGVRFMNYKLNLFTGGGNSDQYYYDRECHFDNILGLSSKFYDLEVDEGEKYNLINNSKYSLLIETMKGMINNHIKSFQEKGSEMERGDNLTGFPCANYPCFKYPECCYLE